MSRPGLTAEQFVEQAVGERRFTKQWVSMLWRAMGATGKGYRYPSTKRTGVGDDRRKDKLDNPLQPKWHRSYAKRYAGV